MTAPTTREVADAVVVPYSHAAKVVTPLQVIAVHADRDESTHALPADFDQLIAKLPDATAHVWYEAPREEWPAERTGLVDLGDVAIPDRSTADLCGPLPFLRSVRAQLVDGGVPAVDIHYEVFGPDMWLAQR